MAQQSDTTPSAGKFSGADFAQWFFLIVLIVIVAAIGVTIN
jgi:hypothetical protein